MYVIKRNGDQVIFDGNKIIDAINKAFIEVDGCLYEQDTATDITLEIARKVDMCPAGVPVEVIQDWVEEALMKSERPDVARAYIRYRYKREISRKHKDDFMQAIAEKLEGKNLENSNANVDEASFGGRLGEATNVLTKQYALDYCLSDMARKNHLENMIYEHDLSHYAVGDHNCLTCPFDEVLAKGFNTRQTDVRPANAVSTAFQLTAVIFQLQSLQQFGGTSASHYDWTMVPYVRKSFYKHYCDGVKYIEEREIDYEFTPDSPIDWNDYKIFSPRAYKYALDMTEKEVAQGAEGLLHNLNTLQSRSGN